MQRILPLLIGAWLLLPGSVLAAEALTVVATIRPLHSLVAAVMAGAGHPILLLRPGASPHDYSLRPSDAGILEKARLVFWMGPELETFLPGPLRSLAPRARSVPLLATPGLRRLGIRDQSAQDTAAVDPHAWLDPDNARIMATRIAAALAAADADNARLYRQNARRLERRLERLSSEIDTLLAPLRERPYIVYHDAYQYFERRFGIRSAAAVSIHPEVPVGAGQMRRIQALVRERNIRCVFTEPQFQPPLLRILLAIPGVRRASLDPLGADLPPGPGLYEELLRGDAQSIIDCLSN